MVLRDQGAVPEPHGDIHLGLSDAGAPVAIKRIPAALSTPRSRSHPSADLKALCRLRHPNLVACLGYAEGDSFVVVREYLVASVAKVQAHFGRLPAPVVQRYAAGMVRGLGYLHTHGIVHGDVRPDNFLLGVDGVCKLLWYPAAPPSSSSSPCSPPLPPRRGPLRRPRVEQN
eukprot:TRINITY_DN6017_c0_g1_i1.p3 TRINITY_DN6017_c0_g1~~TRINITY_DN6017_c0_g1_i1.p3  ORF type:complete len:172 (-),score=40.96 TRINITY_DN6017_c0_g1_i1:27-542(-)